MKIIKSIYYTLFWLIRLLMHSYQLLNINNLKKRAALYNANSLIILGNGKSLNEDLVMSEMKVIEYMVVNRHVLSESYSTLKPRHYVIVDPHFFFKTEGLQILEKIKEETKWPLNFYIPSWWKVKKQVKKIFSDSDTITIVPYNTMEFKGFNVIKKFLYDINMSSPINTNVLVGAIFVGTSLMFKEIKLYGVEHSWIKSLSVNNKNEVCLNNPHFFDKTKTISKTWNELFNEDKKIHEVLEMYASMFKSYHDLQLYAGHKKVKIINCTMNSLIDAFPRSTE